MDRGKSELYGFRNVRIKQKNSGSYNGFPLYEPLFLLYYRRVLRNSSEKEEINGTDR